MPPNGLISNKNLTRKHIFKIARYLKSNSMPGMVVGGHDFAFLHTNWRILTPHLNSTEFANSVEFARFELGGGMVMGKRKAPYGSLWFIIAHHSSLCGSVPSPALGYNRESRWESGEIAENRGNFGKSGKSGKIWEYSVTYGSLWFNMAHHTVHYSSVWLIIAHYGSYSLIMAH